MTTFVSVNSSLREYKGKGEFPWLVRGRTRLLHATKNGLPRDEEFPTLHAWEDSVEAALSKACRYAYAGQITPTGFREVLFYVDRGDAVLSALKKTEGGRRDPAFEFSVEHDDRWEKVARYLAKPN